MTDGNTHAINRHLAEREEYDRQQELLDAERRVPDLEERLEELEASQADLVRAGYLAGLEAAANTCKMYFMDAGPTARHERGITGEVAHVIRALSPDPEALAAIVAQVMDGK